MSPVTAVAHHLVMMAVATCVVAALVLVIVGIEYGRPVAQGAPDFVARPTPTVTPTPTTPKHTQHLSLIHI